MHCRGLFFLVGFVASGAFCADYDIFQDYDPLSSDTTLALASTGEFDPFTTNEDWSTKLNLEDIPEFANQEDSPTLFDFGDSEYSSDQLVSSNILASVDDTCILPPARRIRARDNDHPSCSNSLGNLPNLSPDVLLNENLQIPRYGRKITDYEDADQRLMGQAYCPSQKITLPGLIIPVCDSGIPGFTQPLLLNDLYTVIDGFLSILLLHSFSLSLSLSLLSHPLKIYLRSTSIITQKLTNLTQRR